MLKGLKNELEHQQSAFDELMSIYRSKESEFEDLKVRVAEQLKSLSMKESEISSFRAELQRKETEIIEKDAIIKSKLQIFNKL